MNIKVALKQAVLQGSNHSEMLQRIAVVYIDAKGYTVYAPPAATGNAVEWFDHWHVHHPGDGFGEVDVTHDALGVLAKRETLEVLKNTTREAIQKTGKHPDGRHSMAQICLKGHVRCCDGDPIEAGIHCIQCGAPCIDECERCKDPILGALVYQPKTFVFPLYCHKCGAPYPWMEERLTTARELLRHDDKLTQEDRQALWSDLQYVMSDPKSDLVPAKKKLVEIMLGKASPYVRDAILDLIAKTFAEMAKG